MPTLANPTTRQVNIKNYADMFALFLVLAGTSMFLTFDAAGNSRNINGKKGFFISDIHVSEVATFGIVLGVIEQLFLAVVARCNQFDQIPPGVRAGKVASLTAAFITFSAADELLHYADPELNQYLKGEIAAFIGSATLASFTHLFSATSTLRDLTHGTLKAYAAFGTFVAVNNALQQISRQLSRQPLPASVAAGAGVACQSALNYLLKCKRNEENRSGAQFSDGSDGDSFDGDVQQAGEKKQADGEFSDTNPYVRLQGDDVGALYPSASRLVP